MSRLLAKRALNWVFSQSYNNIKESFNAAKIKPFKSNFLYRLTWDIKVADILYTIGKGKGANLKRVFTSYLKYKQRL